MKRENDPSAPGTALFNWYPGHMAKALREIKQKLSLVDVVLEIRDARVPMVSGNSELDATLGQKKKIIVLNKSNLADPAVSKKWEEWFKAQNMPALFINCFDKAAVKKVLKLAQSLVVNKKKLRLMIVGLPNTGKSTFINQIASKNAAKVADKPGQTQIQQWIEVSDEIDLLDTPGVMPPKIFRPEHALWLSAVHAIPDDIADEESTARFLVERLLKSGSKEFQERFKLDDLKLSLEETLLQIAKVRGCLKGQGLPDLARVHKLILAEFRAGELGKMSFDLPPR